MDKFFPVVGVIEEVNITLKVLEKYMPEYFSDSFELYYNHKDVASSRNMNKFKVPVSDKVKKIIELKFSNELEFYYFCKERLFRQYSKLI